MQMKKKFMLMALIVFTALVASHEGFAQYSCDDREITSGIVHALGWKLSKDLLALEIARLTSNCAQTTCPYSHPFLNLFTRILIW